MQLGFEAVCLDLDFTAPTINSPRLSSLFTFFYTDLGIKGYSPTGLVFCRIGVTKNLEVYIRYVFVNFAPFTRDNRSSNVLDSINRLD